LNERGLERKPCRYSRCVGGGDAIGDAIGDEIGDAIGDGATAGTATAGGDGTRRV
jgi:hypothetical protein